MSVEKGCKEAGLPSTKTQLCTIKREKILIEHRFWKNAINKILDGFTEEEFEE
jgi:hypothetical protein